MKASTPKPLAECVTPVGTLVIGASERALTLCDWKDSRHIEKHIACARLSANGSLLLEEAQRQIQEYFAGKRKLFTLPLAPTGTPFQRLVWKTLLETGYGETKSYSQIATEIGRPEATRAVASAVGANPLSIFVPCHRVIGSRGRLTGYAGGLPAKKYMLELEGSKN